MTSQPDDIPEFFGRYRRTLQERADIRASAGLSAGDLEQLEALYGLRSGAGRTHGRELAEN